MISTPAIEPAISTLPVMNQLIAKVSMVPKARQLIALVTDRECVSPPRNKITLGPSIPNVSAKPLPRQATALLIAGMMPRIRRELACFSQPDDVRCRIGQAHLHNRGLCAQPSRPR